MKKNPRIILIIILLFVITVAATTMATIRLTPPLEEGRIRYEDYRVGINVPINEIAKYLNENNKSVIFIITYSGDSFTKIITNIEEIAKRYETLYVFLSYKECETGGENEKESKEGRTRRVLSEIEENGLEAHQEKSLSGNQVYIIKRQ